MIVRGHAYVVVASALSVACLTITSGTTQEVKIDSRPEGARVLITPGERVVTTPAEADLARDENYQLEFSLDGFESEVVHINRKFSRHVFWSGWIDTLTGAVYDLDPSVLEVELREKGSVPDGRSESTEGERRVVVVVNTGGSLLEIAVDGDPFCSLGRKQYASARVAPGKHEVKLRSQPGLDFESHSVVVGSSGTSMIGVTPWGFGSKATTLEKPPRGFPKSYREPAGCRLPSTPNAQ